MQDRRKEQRWPTYLGGRTSFFHGGSTGDVLIRNASASGARLVVDHGDFIPDAFKLEVPQKQKEYDVRVQWRRQNEIGIKFD